MQRGRISSCRLHWFECELISPCTHHIPALRHVALCLMYYAQVSYFCCRCVARADLFPWMKITSSFLCVSTRGKFVLGYIWRKYKTFRLFEMICFRVKSLRWLICVEAEIICYRLYLCVKANYIFAKDKGMGHLHWFEGKLMSPPHVHHCAGGVPDPLYMTQNLK